MVRTNHSNVRTGYNTVSIEHNEPRGGYNNECSRYNEANSDHNQPNTNHNLPSIMAKEEIRRVQPEIISEDQDCHAAVKGLSDYKPSDTTFAKTALQAASDDLDDAHEKETQAETAWQAARDRAVKAEWTFHNLVLGTKIQVKAQYGDDSDEIKSLGLKKKSEYKRPTRKAKTVPLPKAA